MQYDRRRLASINNRICHPESEDRAVNSGICEGGRCHCTEIAAAGLGEKTAGLQEGHAASASHAALAQTAAHAEATAVINREFVYKASANICITLSLGILAVRCL